MTSDIVECYSGSEYGEHPVALYWEGERLAVEEMIDRQRIPAGLHFLVKTIDGNYFELDYDQSKDGWTIRRFA